MAKEKLSYGTVPLDEGTQDRADIENPGLDTRPDLREATPTRILESRRTDDDLATTTERSTPSEVIASMKRGLEISDPETFGAVNQIATAFENAMIRLISADPDRSAGILDDVSKLVGSLNIALMSKDPNAPEKVEDIIRVVGEEGQRLRESIDATEAAIRSDNRDRSTTPLEEKSSTEKESMRVAA